MSGMTVIDEARRRLREMQLAGDGRAGSWARSEARRRQWDYLKRIRAFVATTLFVVVGCSAAAVLLIPSAFVQGLAVGGLIVGSLCAVAGLVVQATGTASTGMGALAEQWTAAELRPLRRDGWKVVNHMALRPWDIDHVVIGAAGVLAVETKWSARGWSVDRLDRYLREALRQVRNNANDLRIWKDFRSNGVDFVQPVLFLWGTAGGGITTPNAPIIIDGVIVIYGKEAARHWRLDVSSGEKPSDPQPAKLSSQALDALWGALDARTRRVDQLELERNPQLPSLARLYWTGLGIFVAGSGSLFLSLEAGMRVRAWWQWGVIVLLAALGARILGRRVVKLRLYVGGWLFGLLVALALVVVRQAAFL